MNDDLVERLRSVVERLRTESGNPTWLLCREAADEIERLKAALKEILRKVEVWTDVHYDHCSQADEICITIEDILGKTRDEILGEGK